MAISSTKIERQQEGDQLTIKVSGYLGEGSELYNINFAGIKTLILDLAGVNYINSVGVKHWILWTRKFPDDLQVKFVNTPFLIVNQMNMVVDFLPKNSVVESLFAPYYCDKCSKDKSILFERGKHYKYATDSVSKEIYYPDEKSIQCEREGCEMDFDAVEDKFFNFLTNMQSSDEDVS